MKLIIGGSTGYVATELIRQALVNPAISSIVALGRREATQLPNAAKLKWVICDDFVNYSDGVKIDLEGADACIWYDCFRPFLMRVTFAPGSPPAVTQSSGRVKCLENGDLIFNQDYRGHSYEAFYSTIRGDVQDLSRLCRYSAQDPRCWSPEARSLIPVHIHEWSFCPSEPGGGA